MFWTQLHVLYFHKTGRAVGLFTPASPQTWVMRCATTVKMAVTSLGNRNFSGPSSSRNTIVYAVSCWSKCWHVAHDYIQTKSCGCERKKVGFSFRFFPPLRLHLRSGVPGSVRPALGFFTVLPCRIWIKQHCTGLWRHGGLCFTRDLPFLLFQLAHRRVLCIWRRLYNSACGW